MLDVCTKWILRYHEHDSLLKNRPEEALSAAEIDEAWLEYESEIHGESLGSKNQNKTKIKFNPELLQLLIIHNCLPSGLNLNEKFQLILRSSWIQSCYLAEQI